MSVHRLPVALMQPEQAERKRTQDRINQRHSRAKKKTRIEELEAINKDLTTKLTAAEAEVKRLRDREAAFRKALKDASSLLNFPNDLAEDGPNERLSNVEDFSDSLVRTVSGLSAASAPPPPRRSMSHSVRSTSMSIGSDSRSMHNHHSPLDTISPSLDLSGAYMLDLPPGFGDGATVNLLSDPFEFGLGPFGMQHNDTLWTQPYPSSRGCVPDWQALPLNTPAITPLDKVLQQTAEAGRQWSAKSGKHHDELSQQNFPSISSLLNPSAEDSVNNPIAKAAGTQIWRTIIVSFPAKVAFYYLIANMIRWMVAPTEQNYQMLPEYIRPTQLQRTVAHPSWIDMYAWPEARDALIRNIDSVDFTEFRRIGSPTFSVNWPYADMDTFLSSTDNRQLILNPVFVAHIRDIKNYTIGNETKERYPFMADAPTEPGIGWSKRGDYMLD